jgi:GIY-YIG catalytic domain
VHPCNGCGIIVAGKSAEQSPFETRELRKALKAFFALPYSIKGEAGSHPVGWFKWGVYIFYDYDGEPIYVGQTKEKVSGRIGRHLTNQRTDAVAMSVLDPFEVCEIEVYPLSQYQEVHAKHARYAEAKQHLNALEHAVHQKAKGESKFKAILNEKDPPPPLVECSIPSSLRGTIVSDEVRKLRGHSDTRTARRAQVISRLAQTIAERQPNVGLRRTLVTQASRLRWLAEQRFKALGGDKAVEKAPEESDEDGAD